MKEIKFRAFDGNKMVRVSQLSWVNDAKINHLMEINDESPKWFKLMQFTGLKDINGVDIYEGDIVDDKFDCGQLRIISWDNDKACFVGIEIMKPPIYKNMTPYSYPIEISPSTITEGKVIGNIHQNPELLEQQT